MKKANSSIAIVIFLFLISVIVYAIQIVVYDSPRDTGFYILQDLAFLPVTIAIVTIVLGKYLKNREKAERLKKINVVISAFFSEAGTDILMILTSFSKNCDELRAKLSIQNDWTDSNFIQTVKYLEKTDIQIECDAIKLVSLKALMKSKRSFLIRTIENPNLFEHDTFTDTLLSVYHVMEELIARSEFEEDSKADAAHISNDVKRAQKSLLIQWVEYMRHLHSEYPYLYSLEIRKNPFLKERKVVIND